MKDGATTGKSAIVEDNFPLPDAMINEHTFILRTKSSLHPKFCFYCLRSGFASDCFGAARQRGVIGSLSKSFVAEIEIPVPPLEEQRRIVSRIEALTRRAEQARRLRQEAIERAQAAFQRTINAAFEDLDAECVPLEQFLKGKPRNGWSPPADSHSDEGAPVLTLSAVTGFAYNGTKIKWTSAPTKPDAHYWLKPDELLITRSNTPDLVGHAAIYDGNPKHCICPDLIMKMTVDTSRANIFFIHYWIQSYKVREYIKSKARGTSGTMKKIKQSHVQAIPVPNVGRAIQNRIVRHLDGLRERANELAYLQSETDAELAAFPPALLAKAFQGEL